MSSPEVEKFEITEEDLLGEFNPQHRRQFQQSKNKATYGIWAADSDDDERPSFKGGGHNADYAGGISFISGGFKKKSDLPVSTEMLEKEPRDDRYSDSDDEAPPPPKPSFKAAKASSKVKGFSAKYQSQDNIGHWERHTRGIGASLLKKMGHVPGRGLGKDLQGISTPVEAKLRKGKAAIGYYGSEIVSRAVPVAPDSEDEETEEFQRQMQQWKRGEGDVKRKPKYTYKTAEDLLISGVTSSGKNKKQAMQSKLSKVKVIDMTGKEQRVLSGYHALSHKHDRPDEDDIRIPCVDAKQVFDLPELTHNLDLLVNMAEDEIINNSRRLQHEQDMVINLKHESVKLTEVCKEEEKQIVRIKDVFEMIEECERRMQQDCMDALGVDECAEIYRKLQTDYSTEYQTYNLSTLAIAVVVPLMKREFEGWKPLVHPRLCVGAMREWRDILEDPAKYVSKTGQNDMDPYDRLLWDVWMPHIRTVTLDSWNVKHCDPMLELLETWKPLLPEWIIDNITDQLIMPRLQTEVDNWNPTTDTMPIHAWLHPWLPFMGKRLEPLYAPIRHKLADALKSWHPSDPSAKMILDPWIPVFQHGHMEAFVCKNILPKLAIAMADFVINPHKQHLDAWMWVMSWQDILPIMSLVSLLDKHFFPKWHQVLSSWLNNRPNYEEVTNWYKGWKSMFSEKLLNIPLIKDQMNRALAIMDRAVSGNLPPGTSSYLTNTEILQGTVGGPAGTGPQGHVTPPSLLQPPPPPPRLMSQNMHRAASFSSVPESFKDLIVQRAEELGILFMPIPGKTWEAKQVYRFGNGHICIDRGVVFMQAPNLQWLPTSLNTVIDTIGR